MLRPIPFKILRSTATVKACSGTDVYQNQVYDTYVVSHVHLQPAERIVKTKENTDATLSSMLFVDARRSYPLLDWKALLKSAHDKGGDIKVTVRGTEYTVMTVDELMDDADRLHHYEIGLV